MKAETTFRLPLLPSMRAMLALHRQAPQPANLPDHVGIEIYERRDKRNWRLRGKGLEERIYSGYWRADHLHLVQESDRPSWPSLEALQAWGQWMESLYLACGQGVRNGGWDR